MPSSTPESKMSSLNAEIKDIDTKIEKAHAKVRKLYSDYKDADAALDKLRHEKQSSITKYQGMLR